ncbi:hypothetical protein [Salinactinospora qingdaonensis]|uniref:Uncharacterized protein n=1 Tax=Salinactinospora qingdaonensis TaxID=702744 RepID=A0ABP7FT13_9ACTN
MDPDDERPASEPPPPPADEGGGTAWLETYVRHRFAEIGDELTAEEHEERGERATGTAESVDGPEPPEPPQVTADDIAPHLARLARRYRRGPVQD